MSRDWCPGPCAPPSTTCPEFKGRRELRPFWSNPAPPPRHAPGQSIGSNLGLTSQIFVLGHSLSLDGRGMALLLRRDGTSMTTPHHFERTGPNGSTNCEDVAPRAVQDLPHECAPGAHVVARGRTWIVTRVDPYARCGVVALASARSALSLIVPVDRIEAVAGRGRWRRARMGRVAHTVLTSIVGGTPFARLPSGAAGLVLLPWQSAVAAAFD